MDGESRLIDTGAGTVRMILLEAPVVKDCPPPKPGKLDLRKFTRENVIANTGVVPLPKPKQQKNPFITFIKEVIPPEDLETAVMIAESVTDGTQSSYKNVVNQYNNFLILNGGEKFDISVEMVKKYLLYLKSVNKSYFFVRVYKGAVAFLADCLELKDPFVDSRRLGRMWKGLLKRQSGLKKKTKKATPLPRLWLNMLYEKFIAHHTNILDIPLQDLRNIVCLVLQFYTMARLSDLMHIRACDVTLDRCENGDKKLCIYFPTSKNDQLHDGNVSVIIEDRFNPFCPVQLILIFFDRMRAIPSTRYKKIDVNHIISGVRAVKHNGKWIQLHDKRQLQPKKITEQTRAMLRGCGYQAPYTSISAKCSGVTYAFSHGATKKEIQIAGRWRDESTAELYQREFSTYKERAAYKMRANAPRQYAAEFFDGIQTRQLRETTGRYSLPDIMTDNLENNPLELMEIILE